MGISLVKQAEIYLAIQIFVNQKHYPVTILCEIAGISRAAYYKWLHKDKSKNELQNEKISEFICEAYAEKDGILGYRQMTIKLRREQKLIINYKRIYRLMRILGLKSVCRKRKHNYIKSTPEVTAENILNRQFKAEHTCEKWLTDVTEFKYGNYKKAYLSAILNLADKSIVSYVIGSSNNNPLVFKTFDLAVKAHPGATPLFHSDRGFQYTNKIFKDKLDKEGMTQSMSRVGRCIDNGPMEAFWGMLKSEMYYLHKFDDYKSLEKAVEDYIVYYNSKRYQKRLKSMTPLEYRGYLSSIVA